MNETHLAFVVWLLIAVVLGLLLFTKPAKRCYVWNATGFEQVRCQ